MFDWRSDRLILGTYYSISELTGAKIDASSGSLESKKDVPGASLLVRCGRLYTLQKKKNENLKREHTSFGSRVVLEQHYFRSARDVFYSFFSPPDIQAGD